MTAARELFLEAIAASDRAIDLTEAALAIAAEEDPALQPQPYREQLDRLTETLAQQMPEAPYPLRRIRAINHYLFEQLGFHGNHRHYYDPANSLLPRVLERRTGIPITLSLVYLELARRVGLPMVGIGLPGHFLIRPEFEGTGIFVDPFHSGDLLFEQDCADRLQQLYGAGMVLRPEYLQPVQGRPFLARMLQNLKGCYLQASQLDRARACLDRLLLLHPNDSTSLRERGILNCHLEHWGEARQDLETYLKRCPDAEDASSLRSLLDRLPLAF